MNQPVRNLGRALALWAILCGPAWSSDDDDPPAPVPADDAPVIDASIVERSVFREHPGPGGIQRGGDAVTGRARIESELRAILNELVQVCELNEVQRKRLALAARGDIKRFFERVDEVRQQVIAAKNDQIQLQPVWQEVNSLHQQFSRGLFGEESLFAKTVRTTLTEEQLAKYHVARAARRRVFYQIAIDASLARLGNGIALRSEQQAAIQKLLLDQTQPPLQFGQFDQQVVLLRLSELPAAKLRNVLDKAQWKQFRPQLAQAGGTEDYLARFGVIEEPNFKSPVILRSVRTIVEAPAVAPGDKVKPD